MSNPILNLLPSVIFVVLVAWAYAYLVSHWLRDPPLPKTPVDDRQIHDLMKAAHDHAHLRRVK